MNDARCFHLVHPADWFGRPAVEWAPRSLTVEGFVHASTAEQLAGTLAAHCAEESELLLFELCRVRTADALRFEPSRGGARFPHLYRALEPADVLRWWRIGRRGEAWTLPHLGAEPGVDAPAGAPGAPPDQVP